jgi:hemolysin activation/secretion protein
LSPPKAAFNRNEITEPPFDAFGIRANQDLYEINYRQPLMRSPKEEFALSLGFTYQDGQTFLFDNLATPFGIGPDANGVSRTSVIKFGQDYIRREPQGAWFLRSQFSFGIDIPDQTFLVGAGLGLLWNQAMGIDNLFLRLDYGFPFIDLSDRGNNAQDDGFYFSLRYQP